MPALSAATRPPWAANRVEVERTRRHLRDALGDAAFDAAWARGRAMGLDAAIAYATGDDHEANLG